MMKKTASALAVAALMGTGAASAATFQINNDTTLSLYGNVQIAYADINDANGDGVSDVTDNGTTLGVAVEHMFDNGLTGFAKLEEDGFDAVDSGATGNQTDEAYFGLRGDFGSIQFGRDDSLYDDSVADYWDYQEFVVPTNPGGFTQQRGLKYYSPDFGGFSFGAEFQLNGDVDEAGPDVNGDEGSGVSPALMAQYQTGGLTVVGSYDDRANQTDGAGNVLDSGIFGLVASYDFGQFTLDGGYQLEQLEDDEKNGSGDRDIFSLGGRFNYGPGDIYVVGQNVSYDNQVGGDDSFTEVVLGVNYNIGSNFYVYGEYGQFDQQNDAGDGFAIGGLYSW